MALQKDHAIVRAFDGQRALPPWVAYLKLYYADPNESWYDGRGPGAGNMRVAVHDAVVVTR